MIRVEDIDVWGFQHAIRGMRNPMKSWDRSDSNGIVIGENDLTLMKRLVRSGSNGNTAHRKFLRQIFVSMDVVAPLYWWKEFDTYKVGTVTNSCSTMHKIHSRSLELSDFSIEHLSPKSEEMMVDIISLINYYRTLYIENERKEDWWQLIQLLPTSYNQRRTLTLNYENVFSIILQRKGHKLDEWNRFIDILMKLPYVKELVEG